MNPLDLFLCTSMPCIWSVLSACRPFVDPPLLRGPVSPRWVADHQPTNLMARKMERAGWRWLLRINSQG